MKKSALFILGFLVLSNFIALGAVFYLEQPGVLEVNFFDVGQGDAIFIETPKKHQILIDGGPSSVILEKLNKEMPFWDRSLDLIILSHPDKDHLTGLLAVLKRYKVENILWTGVIKETSGFGEWQDLIEKEKTKEGAKIIIAEAGKKVSASEVILEILNPLENLEGKTVKEVNDTSIVSHLIFGENSFLFSGDISDKVEKRLVLNDLPLKFDVLKVAHHGSKYSSSEIFLEKVSAKIAVICVGKNSYGNPTEEVLTRLEKFGIKVLRTDQDGDIKIFSDGENLKLKTQSQKSKVTVLN